MSDRTVRLRWRYTHAPRLTDLHERLAAALDCLYLSTRAGTGYRLPRPVRTEIRLDDQP